MHISLKQLQIFETVAAQQSYTKAAKLLFLSQPAVSMQIKQLEEQAGLPLFDRSGKQTNLTEAGTELLHHARLIHQQLRDASQMMQEMRGLKRGRPWVAARSQGALSVHSTKILPNRMALVAMDAPLSLLKINGVRRKVPVDHGMAVQVEIESLLPDGRGCQDEWPER